MNINLIIIREIENEIWRELPLLILMIIFAPHYEVDDGNNVFRLNNLRTLCLAHNSRGHEQPGRDSDVSNHIRGDVSA